MRKEVGTTTKDLSYNKCRYDETRISTKKNNLGIGKGEIFVRLEERK